MQKMLETWVRSLGREDPPREGYGNALQYSCLENPMDRGVWWITVHGVAESDMNEQLSMHVIPYTDNMGEITAVCLSVSLSLPETLSNA